MNTLVQKVIGESDIALGGMEADPQDMQRILKMIHDRFIEERTAGFKHPETGAYVAPISPEEAEQRWQRASSRFSKLIGGVEPRSPDAERFGLHHREAPARYAHPQAQ